MQDSSSTNRSPLSLALTRLGLILALVMAAWGAGPAPVARAATTCTIDVDDVDDNNPAGGCTLREAIDVANYGWGAGTHFNGCTVTESGSGDPTTYVMNLPSYTYTLSGAAGDNNNWTGDIDVAADVTINGAGADSTYIDGANNDRVLHIDPMGAGGLTVNLVGVTIRDGFVGSDGGGVYNDGDNTLSISACTISSNWAVQASGAAGGGIYNDGGVVNLTDSTISENRAQAGPGNAARGGGIHTSSGTVNATGSTIHNNTVFITAGETSRAHGGGIHGDFSTVSITNTTISENRTTGSVSGDFDGSGGGIYAESGTVNVTDGSTLTGNQANDGGGGIYGYGVTLTVDDSTISGNFAMDGGGIYAFRGGVNVVDGCTIHDNQAGNYGGGIYNSYLGRATVDGSTVSDNTAADGGGIYNQGRLNVQNGSTIGGTAAGNYATSGGGIYNASGGTTTVDGSVVSGNTATYGGGVYNWATLNVQNGSTVGGAGVGNQATAFGGGIYNTSGATTVDGSTVSDNTAADGGGICNWATLTVTNGTIGGIGAANRATNRGGGIYNASGGTATVTGARILANTAATDGGAVYNDKDTTGAALVTGSCIVGNSATSFFNNQAAQQIATGNWWGAAGGPNTPGADTVAGNVDTSAYLTAPPAFCLYYVYLPLAVRSP